MRYIFPGIIFTLFFYSCKTPAGVFTSKTAHEQYGDKIINLGLKQTALGSRWFEAAAKGINNAVPVQLPYKESGYFAPDRPDATGLRFDTKRGEQLTIELSKTPANNYLFADLFLYTNGTTRYIQSIDTATNLLRYTAKENSNFILRLQPELLQSGSYTIVVKTGPSLAFPVSSPGAKNRIISFWGAGRDGGARKHEGVDIGGAAGTPLVAAGDGTVSSVTENNLGGKVVFIRSAERNETWYYAHLDSQIATTGQRVKAGDVIGLMGNTGNARTTSPHLHFGIYAMGGAIDPFPYINPVKKEPQPITASVAMLGKKMRLSGNRLKMYASPDLNAGETISTNTPVIITAATNNLYKAVLPGGEIRFIAAANVAPIEKRIKPLTLKEAADLTDAPAEGSPVIENLPAGSVVDLLGIYGQYQLIGSGSKQGWISQ